MTEHSHIPVTYYINYMGVTYLCVATPPLSLPCICLHCETLFSEKMIDSENFHFQFSVWSLLSIGLNILIIFIYNDVGLLSEVSISQSTFNALVICEAIKL